MIDARPGPTPDAPGRVPEDGVFLDHVGLYVPDLERAPARLEVLGFTLTPLAAHADAGAPGEPPTPSGTGNRCAMLEEGYLEVLAPTGEDTPLAREVHANLRRYAGLHLVAFAVADAEARQRALARAGFPVLPLVRLRRPVATADGEGVCAFDVVRTPTEAMPEGRIQMLTHHTPELVWQRRLLAHPNGVEGLSGVLVCVADVAEAARRVGRFIASPVRLGGERAEVELARGRASVVSAAALGRVIPGLAAPCVPYIAAIGLRSADLEASARFMAERGVGLVRLDDRRLLVPGAEALGMNVVLHRRDAPPWD